MLQTRPFAPIVQKVEAASPPTPEQMEAVELFGFNAASVPAFSPSPPPSVVQREEVTEENTQEQAEAEKEEQPLGLGLGAELEKPQDVLPPSQEGTLQRKCDECEGEQKEEKEGEKQTGSIQTKEEIPGIADDFNLNLLTVGEPGDKYEQEADAVAPDVVDKINVPATEGSAQQQFELGGASELNITVMRQSEDGVGSGSLVSQDVEQGIQQARGGRIGLDDIVRKQREKVEGSDFGDQEQEFLIAASPQLTEFLSQTVPSERSTEVHYYPFNNNYEHAYGNAWYWFSRITTGTPRLAPGKSSRVGAIYTADLIGGGKANLRQYGGGDLYPTIDLLNHKTPSYENIKEVKFLYPLEQDYCPASILDELEVAGTQLLREVQVGDKCSPSHSKNKPETLTE